MTDLAGRVAGTTIPALAAGVSRRGARTGEPTRRSPSSSCSGRVALANRTDALPEIARLLSDLQYPLTGDDLATQIDAFAA